MTLVRFYCLEHGYLCDAPERASVICGQPRAVNKGASRRCNRKATTTDPRRTK